MTKKNKRKFTLKIIKLDAYLNWFLGLFFLAKPDLFQSLLFPSLKLPSLFWLLASLVFLGFAAWQTFFMVIPQSINVCQLQTAAALAWLPFLGLTYILVLLPTVFYPRAFLILWLADLYMFVLGTWYLYIAFNSK